MGNDVRLTSMTVYLDLVKIMGNVSTESMDINVNVRGTLVGQIVNLVRYVFFVTATRSIYFIMKCDLHYLSSIINRISLFVSNRSNHGK